MKSVLNKKKKFYKFNNIFKIYINFIKKINKN